MKYHDRRHGGAPEDSNVNVVVSMVDVRCKAGTSPCGPANAAGGADYTGQVELVLSLQITDRWNAPTPGGGTDPATGEDTTIRATIGCSSSPSTGTGSSCSVTTDVNAITLGTGARHEAGDLAARPGRHERRWAGRGRVDGLRQQAVRHAGHLRTLIWSGACHPARPENGTGHALRT